MEQVTSPIRNSSSDVEAKIRIQRGIVKEEERGKKDGRREREKENLEFDFRRDTEG